MVIVRVRTTRSKIRNPSDSKLRFVTHTELQYKTYLFWLSFTNNGDILWKLWTKIQLGSDRFDSIKWILSLKGFWLYKADCDASFLHKNYFCSVFYNFLKLATLMLRHHTLNEGSNPGWLVIMRAYGLLVLH